MQLLETYPQDIKSARNYKPCAPESFRWIVAGSYIAVLLSIAVWSVFVFREHQLDNLANQDRKKLDEINAQISATQAQGAHSIEIKTHYEDWNRWLRGNYNLSSFLQEIYKSLPRDTRLQEMSLEAKPSEEGHFSLMMRFFSRGGGSIPNTEDFEDKLTTLGVDQQDRQQSVGDGGRTELNASVVLPSQYYPGGDKNVKYSTGKVPDLPRAAVAGKEKRL
jgi:hypothetical protein